MNQTDKLKKITEKELDDVFKKLTHISLGRHVYLWVKSKVPRKMTAYEWSQLRNSPWGKNEKV